MEIEIKVRAARSLAKLTKWIGDQNTPPAGDNWLERFYLYLEDVARVKVKYPICKDPSLNKFEYLCFTYEDKWVVAYKLEDSKLVIYRFILGSRLNYN